jgi:hypothetical protein
MVIPLLRGLSPESEKKEILCELCASNVADGEYISALGFYCIRKKPYGKQKSVSRDGDPY